MQFSMYLIVILGTPHATELIITSSIVQLKKNSNSAHHILGYATDTDVANAALFYNTRFELQFFFSCFHQIIVVFIVYRRPSGESYRIPKFTPISKFYYLLQSGIPFAIVLLADVTSIATHKQTKNNALSTVPF